jgi:hypothetical protein
MRQSTSIRLALAASISLAPIAALTGCATAPTRTIRREAAADTLVQQRRFDWCWAACCEMAYRAKGQSDITQERLVEAYKGTARAKDEADQRAQDFELVRALAVGTDFYLPIGVYPGGGVTFDRGGLAAYIESWAGLYLASSVAVEDLERGQPVLAVLRDWEGAPGHVGFVIEIAATPDDGANALGAIYGAGRQVGGMIGLSGGDGDSVSQYLPETLPRQYTLHRITFYDPSLENPGVKSIEGDAIKRHLGYLLSPAMAKAILARERDIVKFGGVPTGARVRRR